MACQLAMIRYLMKFRPFKSELQQVICVIDEFVIVLGVLLLYFLLKYQNDIKKSATIGFVIIGVIAAAMVKNLGVIVYVAVKSSYVKFRTWLHKKLIENHQPNRSRQTRPRRRRSMLFLKVNNFSIGRDKTSMCTNHKSQMLGTALFIQKLNSL